MTIEKIEAITQERLRRRIRYEELQKITNRYSISGLKHQKRNSQLVVVLRTAGTRENNVELTISNWIF